MLNCLFTVGVLLTGGVNLFCRILGPAQVTFCLGSGYGGVAFSPLYLMVVLPEGEIITGRLLCVCTIICVCVSLRFV